MKINKSQVIFNEVEHTYNFNGKYLQGITGMLSKHLFPNKYSDIPQHIIEAAKERGKNVHSEIEMFENGFAPSNESEELVNYIQLKKDECFEVIESEFIVSDEKNFASPIDQILKWNGYLCLCDLKTTAVLDLEYLSWQLSILKYLFELRNDITVDKLVAIHLKNNKAKFVEVNVIDKEIIKELLDAEINGTEFKSPFREVSEKEETLIAKVYEIEQFLVVNEAEIKSQKEQQKEYKAELLKIMDLKGVKSLDTDRLKLTRKADSKRVTLDSKKIKEDLPEVYAKYSKESKVKGTVLIKIK